MALQSFIATRGTLLIALGKFVDHKRAEMERNSADSLRTSPRKIDNACDYSAKAEVYGIFLGELERFATNAEPEIMA